MKVPEIRECMNTKLVTLRREMKIEDAINLLLKNRISGAPVVDEDGKLVGVLSEKDCLRIFANSAYNLTPGADVDKYMSTNLTTLTPDVDVFTAAELFMKNPFRRLPIVDENGVLVGQISRRDILNSTHHMWAASPIPKQWTDAKYIPEQVQAVLQGGGKRK